MAHTVPVGQKWWSGGKSPFNVEYGKLMMWYFLMSDAFTFGAFLISYGTIRFSSSSWPDPNEVFRSFPVVGQMTVPLAFVSLMTFILIMSSVTMVMAVGAGQANDRKAVMKWMILTILGGLAFLGCQAWEWYHLHGEGAWWGMNPFINIDGTQSSTNFTNFFFTITGFHGFHVFSGVIINFIMLIKTWRGDFDRKGHYLMIEKARTGILWTWSGFLYLHVFTCYN